MMSYTEQQLVAELKSKNQKVFSYVYDNYSAAIYGMIVRQLSRKDECEDCLQEVFVKIWNNIDSYQTGRGRLFTWMTAITKNHIIDFQRSKAFSKQRKIVSDQFEESYHVPAAHQATYDGLGLTKHILRLAPHHKTVVELCYLAGHSHEDASGILQIPVGTVKTHLRKAIYHLRNAVA